MKIRKQPNIREVSLSDGCGSLWWGRFMDMICLSLEWKSDGVMEGESDDSEGDRTEEHLLVQGWRTEVGSCISEWAICDL